MAARIEPVPDSPRPARRAGERAPDRFEVLRELERKVLWLASWTIHHANHVRPSQDGLKVGGHQASSASVVALMTALYFAVLRPGDRIAVKPHASPAFHAIQYLFGRQTRENLERFPRLRRRAGLSLAHQGRGRRRLLDRFGGAGGGRDAVREHRQGLHSAPTTGSPGVARTGA